ncbi:MAG: hypothetical protein ACHQ0J_10455 [Candidatus Dormibacterales bacterium]
MESVSGADLKAHRLESGVGASELAVAYGCSRQWIHALELRAKVIKESAQRYLEAVAECVARRKQERIAEAHAQLMDALVASQVAEAVSVG